MNTFLNKMVAHISECSWLGFAMLLWSAETFYVLIMNRQIFIKNLQEFPDFVSTLFGNWRNHIIERFDD